MQLERRQILPWGDDTVVFPWRGDQVLNTVAVLLATRGLHVGLDGVALTINRADSGDIRAAAHDLLAAPPPDPTDLAASVPNKERDKYDEYLSEALLSLGYAARNLDLPGAWEALRVIASEPDLDVEMNEVESGSAGLRTLIAPHRVKSWAPELGSTGFAVIDFETTGFAPHLDDRVIEVAVVHVDPDGTATDRWTTLVDPGRDTGPTEIHGIRNDDVRNAPSFAQIADWLSGLLHDRVVVAHNAEFDLAFLVAEYERADADAPLVSSLCTLHLSEELGFLPEGAPRDLHSCCDAAGVTLRHAHTAAGDADATAALLTHTLRLAVSNGATTFSGLRGYVPASDDYRARLRPESEALIAPLPPLLPRS